MSIAAYQRTLKMNCKHTSDEILSACSFPSYLLPQVNLNLAATRAWAVTAHLDLNSMTSLHLQELFEVSDVDEYSKDFSRSRMSDE